MSSPVDNHGPAHSELLGLYVLLALPANELPAAEAQIGACAECRQERETLRQVVDAFVSWPTDVVRPSASLWDRLTHRIGNEAVAEHGWSAADWWAEPEWKDVADGISCKLLSTDRERDRVNMLVRLAPGAAYPPHRHDGIEELYLLDGVLIVDDKTLYPGDYLRSDPGTVDRVVRSETGCTCVLMTSFRDVIL